ncbi:MAG: YqgE/AlgH family protein [Spongiibacteraceae bacterium]
MNETFQSFRNHFLIAMPTLNEGMFAHSVAYICEHSDQGAMGIVINQPMGLPLREVLDHLNIENAHSHLDDPVMAGGPVQTDRGFVLHRTSEQHWESTIVITEEVSLTTSRDILDAMARADGPKESLVALGYAGWSAGQLEDEIAANAWLTLPADSAIIFKVPVENRLTAAAAKLGVNMALMAPGAGHA